MKNFSTICICFVLSLSFILFSSSTGYSAEVTHQKKTLICGVCRNVSHAIPNTITHIEALGTYFADYAVIIYENNSTDNTSALFSEWAARNPKVSFHSENIPPEHLPASRTENIARARNIILTLARDPKYSDFEYLIMADLDFRTPWPIQEILNTINTPDIEWDCVTANGVASKSNLNYWDLYALRNHQIPFGPELIGDQPFWSKVGGYKVSGNQWVRVYSAFGGLAIYKTQSILSSNYSGTATEDLKAYYKYIIPNLSKKNDFIKTYIKMNKVPKGNLMSIPIIFRRNMFNEHPADYQPVTCCEHVPLYASMAMRGFGKIYINPNMFIYYHE